MTLREFMDFVCACAEQAGHSFSEDFADELARQLVRQRPGETVYVPRPDTSKKAAIRDAAQRLPADVVATRYGVTRQWVNRVSKRGLKPERK